MIVAVVVLSLLLAVSVVMSVNLFVVFVFSGLTRYRDESNMLRKALEEAVRMSFRGIAHLKSINPDVLSAIWACVLEKAVSVLTRRKSKEGAGPTK